MCKPDHGFNTSVECFLKNFSTEYESRVVANDGALSIIIIKRFESLNGRYGMDKEKSGNTRAPFRYLSEHKNWKSHNF